MNFPIVYVDISKYSTLSECSHALQYSVALLNKNSPPKEVFLLLEGWKSVINHLSLTGQVDTQTGEGSCNGLNGLSSFLTRMYDACSVGGQPASSGLSFHVVDYTILLVPESYIEAKEMIHTLISAPYPVQSSSSEQEVDFLHREYCLFSFSCVDAPLQTLTEDAFFAFLEESSETAKQNPSEAFLSSYNNSVIGGTFDHLHEGHKVLLSACAFMTKLSLTIGLSDGVLLSRKKFREYIQPFELRKQIIIYYLKLWNSSMEVDIVPLYDSFGPSGDREKLDVLFVSEETRGGGPLVNAKRQENGLLPLEVVVIPLTSNLTASELEMESTKSAKTSSTDRREMKHELKKANGLLNLNKET